MNAGENKPTGLLRLLKKVILPPQGGENHAFRKRKNR